MRSSDLLHFIHTPEFDKSLAEIPAGDDELRAVQNTLQETPEAGDPIPGTGGVIKLRAAAKGRGKRGGMRVLYFPVPSRRMIYLLLAYAKSETDNISEAGKAVLKKIARQIEAETE